MFVHQFSRETDQSEVIKRLASEIYRYPYAPSDGTNSFEMVDGEMVRKGSNRNKGSN